tara:strand:+ start:126 stop:494 length:369 start_codon:yes stop_codon:yes gene_type:complete
MREELAQSVLAELGESQHPAETPYYDYLYIEAGHEWNKDADTHLATLSDDGAKKLAHEVEQLIVGALDGEYGDEVLREWSPWIRPKDWTASLLLNDAISHQRKLSFGGWAHGLTRIALYGYL